MRLPMNTSLATLKPSGIRRINALAAQHPGCIALALGEPDFPTPDVISAEVTAALGRGDTHYPPNNGRPALREALSAYMGEAGLAFSADEVILTDGATEALSATFMAMLNPGDEVIIPTPAFGLYESIVVANHAKAVFLDTEPAQFQIDEDALRACVTPATKAIVICSPNNPTGCILNAASLDAVARVADQAGIYVVCDDVYNRLVYVDGYERFAQRHPELREQTVIIESFSKPWAMTGWRLGWLAAAAPVIAEIAKAHQYLVSSAVSFEMDAAARALTVDPTPMLKVYRARRERVLAALDAMALDVVEPAGAFYAFPSIKQYGLTSEDFCIKGIKEANVALVPGNCFGTEGHIAEGTNEKANPRIIMITVANHHIFRIGRANIVCTKISITDPITISVAPLPIRSYNEPNNGVRMIAPIGSNPGIVPASFGSTLYFCTIKSAAYLMKGNTAE